MSATTSIKPGLLLVVDGHSYAYRAFYAIRKLNSPSGSPTNAIYGFIRMLEKMMITVKPTHAVVVWDGGLSAGRKSLLPGYKAQRPKMPTDLVGQLDEIVAYLGAAKIASWMGDGIEADDAIAALTQRAVGRGANVVIATADKDFMQLVSPSVRLLGPSGDKDAFINEAVVKAKTGVEPVQIVDWLSLIGDAVDNIPGVPGVGPKTAADLLGRYGSVDGMVKEMGSLTSERVRKSLESALDVLRMNQKLIRLDESVPCEIGWDEMALGCADAPVLRSLYERWGFKTLTREVMERISDSEDLFRRVAERCSV